MFASIWSSSGDTKARIKYIRLYLLLNSYKESSFNEAYSFDGWDRMWLRPDVGNPWLFGSGLSPTCVGSLRKRCYLSFFKYNEDI